jgi:hypothetical protein
VRQALPLGAPLALLLTMPLTAQQALPLPLAAP